MPAHWRDGIVRPNRYERRRAATQAPLEKLPFAERRTMSDILKYAKGRAKRLRSYLAELDLPLTHAQSLEAIAKEDGFRDWNTYAANPPAGMAENDVPARAAQRDHQSASRLQFHVGDRVAGIYRGTPYRGTILGLEKTDGGPVWRIKIQFDAPVEIGTSEALSLTRLRIRSMINADGASVNLKGTPDGWLSVTLL
ncbi:glyoxalase superfamily protein [Kordiimonas sp.]|uniref:glyoxalase superfamily protein n=1 Tax=Kordiimonas sp. TaxID=1970157 RepID=UPI003A92E09D